MKRLYTNNRKEYITLKLQFFLREQTIIYKTSIPHQNGCTKQLNCILLVLFLSSFFYKSLSSSPTLKSKKLIVKIEKIDNIDSNIEIQSLSL